MNATLQRQMASQDSQLEDDNGAKPPGQRPRCGSKFTMWESCSRQMWDRSPGACLVGYVSHLLFAFFRCPVTSASIGVDQCRKISRKTTTVILWMRAPKFVGPALFYRSPDILKSAMAVTSPNADRISRLFRYSFTIWPVSKFIMIKSSPKDEILS